MSTTSTTVTTSKTITATLGVGYPVRGEKGDSSYAFFAYANSADGKTDFTLTPVSGKIYTYLGGYVSSSATQSTTASDYKWSLLSDEPARVAAENLRVSAESARATAESNRVSAETNRTSAENKRASAESSRATAETNRANAEKDRADAEEARQQAESTRASNDSKWNAAETQRETDAAKAIADANAAATRLNTFSLTVGDDGYLYMSID